MIFHAYDGIYAELVASATLFADFLCQLATDPIVIIGSALPPSVRRDPGFGYRRILLVAHSLGAVLSRWALLELRDRKVQGLERFEMILYAPAHCGARVPQLIAEVAGAFSFARALASFARFKSPLIQQLERDSAELRTLQERARSAIRECGPKSYLRPFCVAIGERDNVVYNLKFLDDDPPPRAVRGATHIDICKPHATWRDPLTILLANL